MGSLILALLPASGVSVPWYNCLAATLPDQLEDMHDVQPGTSITGNVCFEVSPADAQTAVLLGALRFSGSQSKDRRYFAIQ